MERREIAVAGMVGLTTRHDTMRIDIEPVSYFGIDEDAGDPSCGLKSQKSRSNARGPR